MTNKTVLVLEFARRIISRGDRVYSKMLQRPVDYKEVEDNAEIMFHGTWIQNRAYEASLIIYMNRV